MVDYENQIPPPNPQPPITETLSILLALAAILLPLAVNIPSHFVKHSSADAASCECKLNNCPCLPPFYIFSVVATAALSVVWFGLFVLAARLQYRFVIWVGLGLVWATYWLALGGILPPQFYNPMLYSFNPLLAVLLVFNLMFRCLELRMNVIAGYCVIWNYITGNY
ncbi:origin recognition complex subunit 6-like [Pyrus ussuriensis x Pyrus communis]|uniref:Origin recognition complex subunit 6-like n=1 Tax=Pyrus ussuriensis x Pyrus communis TaxID=2448454 RepID=A0A5N5HA00_9ROSA|nr:origin recognition complex subunit 6-like [Pyrus ussuriensis x Pyrus communis]